MTTEMTEAEWQDAEQRDPTKTYIEPDLTPVFQDWRGRAAVICLLIALIPLCGLISIWPDAPRGTLPTTYFFRQAGPTSP